MGNYIKLYRESLECEQFDDPIDWKIFCWCLLRANYKRRKAFGIWLKPGQFITSYPNAAESLNLDQKTIRNHLRALSDMDAIKVESNNRFTIISVVNFEKWQGSVREEIPSTLPSELPSRLPSQLPTDKKDKNNIKERKEEPPAQLWEEMKKEGFDD